MSRILTGALLGTAMVFATLGAGSLPAAAGGEVNIYSLRQPFLIDPLLKAFTEKTGIKTNVVFAKDGVVERMKAEGANSPADVILTVDIGRLNDAVEAGVVQPVKSAVLEKNVPASFRDPDGRWFALTTRARIIYASKDRVKPGEITSMAGRPEVEGPGLHPQRQARLQRGAAGRDDRPPRRGQGRGMAEGPEGQPRPEGAGQ